MQIASKNDKVYILVERNVVMLVPGADKSLALSGRKQARKNVRDARDFNNIETRAVVKFFFFFPAILTETLACFLPGRAKDLSAPLNIITCERNCRIARVTCEKRAFILLNKYKKVKLYLIGKQRCTIG